MKTEIQNMEEHIEALKKELEKLKAQEKQPQNNGFFVPKKGDGYWYSRVEGGVYRGVCTPVNTFNFMASMSGNCFRTKEQAEAFDFEAKRKRMARFMQVCRKLDEGFDRNRKNYQPVLTATSENKHEIDMMYCPETRYSNLPCFTGVGDKTKQFIKEYHQELLWYFGINDSVDGE